MAKIDIDTIIGQKLTHQARVQRSAALAEMQQIAQIVVDVILFGGALCRVESVVFIVVPAAGESVSRPFVTAEFAVHHHLVAIEKLRITANGRNDGKTHFHQARIAVHQFGVTIHVVIVEHVHHKIDIGIDKILRKVVVVAQGAFVPAFVLLERPIENVAQGEIHHALQAAVETVFVFRTHLEKGVLRRTFHPAFAHDGQIRIFGIERTHQPCGVPNVVVRIGVDAQAIDAGKLDPIGVSLSQIVENQRVSQIVIGHIVVEPPFFEQRDVVFAQIGIRPDGNIVIGARKLRPLMEPIVRRQVFHPPMLYATMIWHNIHYQFQTMHMTRIGQTFVVVVHTETRVDFVIIGAGVMMIRITRIVVVEQRRRPQRRRAEVGNVPQMVDNSLNITALPLMPIATHHTLTISRHIVVRRVAVGKTVGHKQIDSVLRTKTAAFGRSVGTFAQQVIDFLTLFTVCYNKLIHAGLGIFCIDIHKQIVGIVRFFDAHNRQCIVGKSHIAGSHIRTMQHQLQFGVRHTCPPRHRLDTVGQLNIFCNDRHRQAERKAANKHFFHDYQLFKIIRIGLLSIKYIRYSHQRHSADGITMLITMYSSNPGNPAEKMVRNAYKMRTMVTSQPKYSAKPAHTPAIILLFDLVSFLSIGSNNF